MARLALDAITKTFPGNVVALREVGLDVDDGELVVLVGPSGCGKSTLLRIVAGLEHPTAGTVRIDGRSVEGLPPGRRKVAMVFQGSTNFPHMSVRQNLGFGLRVRRSSRAEIDQRVTAVAAVLGLERLLDRRPAELSGGERQRVAIGRAMLRDPDVFLFDEPLSNLDAQLRVEMRREILRLQRRLGATTLFVTHDQAEAMTVGDRVAVLRDGAVEQIAHPQELYDRPHTTFVAGFIGTPPMNLLPARTDGTTTYVGGRRLALAPPATAETGSVAIGVRPDALGEPGSMPGAPTLAVEVELIEHVGPELHITGRVDGTEHRLVARAHRDRSIVPGDHLCLALDVTRLHWFDAETGTAID